MTSHSLFIQSMALKRYWMGIGLPHDKAVKLAVSYFQNGVRDAQDHILDEILPKPYYPMC